jgi:hypothetical protein
MLKALPIFQLSILLTIGFKSIDTKAANAKGIRMNFP